MPGYAGRLALCAGESAAVIRYLVALAFYKIQLYWLICTGQGHRDAPCYLLRSYNAQADAWNTYQNRKMN